MPEPVDKDQGSKTETVVRTLLVAFFVSLACSSLVASAAVLLQAATDRQRHSGHVRRNILEVAGLLQPDRDINELYESIEPRVVDLDTGTYVEDVDPETFDPLRGRQRSRAR